MENDVSDVHKSCTLRGKRNANKAITPKASVDYLNIGQKLISLATLSKNSHPLGPSIALKLVHSLK